MRLSSRRSSKAAHAGAPASSAVAVMNSRPRRRTRGQRTMRGRDRASAAPADAHSASGQLCRRGAQHPFVPAADAGASRRFGAAALACSPANVQHFPDSATPTLDRGSFGRRRAVPDQGDALADAGTRPRPRSSRSGAPGARWCDRRPRTAARRGADRLRIRRSRTGASRCGRPNDDDPALPARRRPRRPGTRCCGRRASQVPMPSAR